MLANATRISTRSAVLGGHLVLRRVAVEDRGDLVAQDEGHREEALGGSAETRERLGRGGRVADVAARRVPRAVGAAEDGVRGERDRDRALTASLWSKPRAYHPTAALFLTMNMAARSTCLRHLGHEVGEHLGEVGALLDRGDRSLEAGVVGQWRTRRRLLREHLGDRRRDRLLVDLLVVAGHLLAQLVERAHERGLVALDGALDLDDPVGHLLADEGGGACLQVVFEAHVLLGGRRRKPSRIPTYVPAHYPAREWGCQRTSAGGMVLGDVDGSRPHPTAPGPLYRRLRARFGHAGWWPGESAFEVCVGAILVQNTAWANVERTLESLRRRGPAFVRALDAASRRRGSRRSCAPRGPSGSRPDGCGPSSTSSARSTGAGSRR